MTDQPQRLQDGQDQDIIDQIMNKSPAYSHPEEADQPESAGNVSTQPIPDAPAEPAPEEKTPAEGGPKNKRSSVYIYLLILFGAAFLMLLLAYFVQQRNSETTISDLRDSMTLSRTQLLEQIETLEEENKSLKIENGKNETALASEKERSEQFEQNIQQLQERLQAVMIRSVSQNILAYLEQFNRTGDWIMSAMLVESCDNLFNQRNMDYDDQCQLYLLPYQVTRYFELREEVFDRAGCMVMEQFITAEDGSEYTERPYIGEGIFEAADLAAAKRLVTAILYYPSILDIAAGFISEDFQPDSTHLERLNGGTFKPSTAELLEQITQDLIDQGLLVKEVDGTLTTRSLLIETLDVSRETAGS